MKRLLAILLSLCLLVPSMGITMVQSVSADTGYIVAEIPYRLDQMGVSTSAGVNYAMTFDPIDLTPYGYPADGSKIAKGKLAISYDIYFAGVDEKGELVSPSVSFTGGQLELTSGGTNDVEEILLGTDSWMATHGTWKRQVIDLADFGAGSTTAFNPAALNFMRIYCTTTYPKEVQHRTIITNVCIVDCTKTAPSTSEWPVGEEVLTAQADPSWKVLSSRSSYENDRVMIGYNLKDYAEIHYGTNVTDYSPIIQSLLDSLSIHGGGNLYIPAGHYPCRSPIVLRSGVSIYGDWAKPDGQTAAGGTILDVYYGEGSVMGVPFISLSSASMVKNLTFWYPEQDINDLKPYSATVSLAGWAWAKNCTFINSCMAVRQGPTFVNCPNAQGIYGTPLTCGMDLGYATDIMRIEGVDFAADYWINSGLPGAPASDADQAALRAHLYQNATGIRLGRIDWSFVTYATVDGYNMGVNFANHSSGVPNGQCHDFTFRNCKVGLNVEALPTTGEMVSKSTFQNCEYGVLVHPYAEAAGDGILQLIDVDITATKCAVYNRQTSMVQLLSSRIHSGTVEADGGWYTIVNTKFNTAAPHIVLQKGALSAVLTGNTTATGGAITVSNLAGCAVNQNNTAANVTVPSYTADEVLEQEKKPTGSKLSYKIATGLDATGATDVTAALNTLMSGMTRGGILYLPNGHYRIDGTVTIPSKVELRGVNDFGRLPYNAGVVFDLHPTGSEPSIVMQEGSGLRGVTINYPEQCHSDTFATDHKFTEYPFAIQGRGSNIWIVNVAIRNAYRGVDLMTYRCDNHYVDYIGGACIDTAIQVGGGSQNGIIRNAQLKQGTFISDTDMGGGWTDGKNPLPSDMDFVVYTHAQNNTTQIKVGDVDNQLLYDNFNFGGYQGMLFVGEATGAADARVIGCAMDYTTVCIDVEQAENIEVMNLQMVSYHNAAIIGEPINGVSRLQKEMHFIRLGSSNTGTVSVAGLNFWANPNWCVNVQNGTLNLYSLNYFTDVAPFAQMSANGTLNVVAPYLKRTNLTLASGNHKRIKIQSGYYLALPTGYASTGAFTQMIKAGLTASVGGDYVVDFTSGELATGGGIEEAFTNPDNGNKETDEAFATKDGITGFGPTSDAAYERYYINVIPTARFYDNACTKYRSTFEVNIKYYDPGTGRGQLVLEYATGTTQKNIQLASGTYTRGWKTVSYVIEDAKFMRHGDALNTLDIRPSFYNYSKDWLMASIEVKPLTYGAVDYNGSATAINDLATYDAKHIANGEFKDPSGGTTAWRNSSTSDDGEERFIAKVNYDAAALGISGSDSVSVLVSYYFEGYRDWNFLSIGTEEHQDNELHQVYRGYIGSGSSLVFDKYPVGKWAVARCDLPHNYLGGSVTICTKNYNAQEVYIGRVAVVPTALLDGTAEYSTVDFNTKSSLDVYFSKSAHPTTSNFEASGAMFVPNNVATYTTFEGQNALKFNASSTVDQTIATVKLSQQVASVAATGGYKVLIPYYLDGTDSGYADTIKIATKDNVITQTMGIGSADSTVVGELAGGTGDTGWQVACFHITLSDYAQSAFKILSGNTKRTLYIGRIVVIPEGLADEAQGSNVAYFDGETSAKYLSYLPSGMGEVTNILAFAGADSGASTKADQVADGVGAKKYAITASANQYWYFRVPTFYNDGVNDKTVSVTVKYLAKGGNLLVNYPTSAGATAGSASVALKNTGKWEIAQVTVKDALLKNSQSYGADIRIGGSSNLTLAFVAITDTPLVTEVAFNGAQLVLEDNLKVVFFAKNPRAQIAKELGYTAEELVCGMRYSFLTIENEIVEADDSAAVEASFAIGNISPDQMGEKFTVTPVYTRNGVVVKEGETIQYSVADYCMALKSIDSDLALSLLGYGATLQKYRDPSISDSELVTNGLTTAEKAAISNMMAGVTANTITAPAVSQNGTQTLRWDAASLIINNGVKMRFKISPAGDVSNLAVKVTDVTTNEVIDICELRAAGGGQYSVTTQLPNPEYISDTLELVLYNTLTGEEISKTLTYSASAYAKSMVGSSNAELADFLKAMMLYEAHVESFIEMYA